MLIKLSQRLTRTLQTGSYSGIYIFLICFLFYLTVSDLSAVVQEQSWSVRMAESVMSRHPNSYGSWDYVTGTILRAFEELWKENSETKYYQYIKSTVDGVVMSNGNIAGYNLADYNIDEIKEGCAVLFLYRQTGEEKYKKAAELLRSQLETHPRTSEGGFWHKQRYPHQMWLDGLYMGSPFYADFGAVFDESEALDDVVNQLTLMEKHARDPETGLLYHGWDESGEQEWADPVTGCSPSFWGRAIGWYAMALVDVLDFLPAEHAGRDSLIAILQRLAEAVSEYQDDSTGVWWQVVDKGGMEGNYLESSVSCMLVYALAKGVRKNYVDAAYRDVAIKGFQGIIEQFIEENPTYGTIDLIQTCCTAGLGNGRDGSYEYYVYGTNICRNDPKGVGSFILASLEMEMASTAVRSSNCSSRMALFSMTSFPNPSNPVTQIQFSVPGRTSVRLILYNSLGQEIRKLIDDVRDAGTYAVPLNASDFESGIYFCHLITETGTVTRKLLLIR